jgi:hypothetical protein
LFVIVNLICGEIQMNVSDVQNIYGVTGHEFLFWIAVMILMGQRFSVDHRPFDYLLYRWKQPIVSIVDFPSQLRPFGGSVRPGREPAVYTFISVFLQFHPRSTSFNTRRH